MDVVSTVSGPVAGEYTYTYEVELVSGTFTGIDAITVNNALLGSGFPTTGLIDIATTAATWSGALNGSNPGHVSWSDGGVDMDVVGDTYSFESPLPPSEGVVFAQDAGQFNGATPVYVPGTPDGGLTVALLGGAMTALALIRSKVGKLK